VNAGRRRAVLLLATLGTFGAALIGPYALTGIWLRHDAPDRWAIAIAFAVAASSAVDKALSPWTEHGPADAGAGAGAGSVPGGTAGDTAADAEPPSGARRPWARSRVTTAVLSAAVVAAASGVVYGVLTPKDHKDHKAGQAAGTTAGYTLVYGHRTLSMKDYTYYLDLRAGAVRSSETAWSLSTNAGGDGNGAFELQPLTDAYVVPGRTAPSAPQCSAGATRHPADGLLHFRQAPPGSVLCLRDTTNGDVAIVAVIDVDHGNYATTDDITYYRHAR